MDQKLYNVAAAVSQGELLGLIPKRYLPNYAEFYEARHFTPGREDVEWVTFDGQEVPFGMNQLFHCADMPGLTVAAEICEDLWVPNPPSVAAAMAGAVGPGFLNVIKDMGMKEPYSSQTMLQTCEIAEDLTYYFATSEQVPSAVGLGVLMNKENTVRQAGGFIIQLMPFAEEKVIAALEQKIQNVTSVTAMLDAGNTPEQILENLLGDLGVEFTDTMETRFHCNCSKERVSKAIISIGKKELQNMIDDGEEIEVNCHFCNTNYKFSVEELEALKKEATR